jgi:AcrR family transcriptional regulator
MGVNISRVAALPEDSGPGLRERKKLRTRATLVDAAMELCLRNGYDNTTVEQIAAAADVSPRTFSRYFATKDAVFMTLIEDYTHEVSIELEAVPVEVGPLEAMRQAHVGVLTRVASRQVGRLSTERIVLMLRVVNASATLRRAAFEFRHHASEVIMAKRMGVDVEDRRRLLVGAIFSGTIVTACSDLIADTETVRLGPTVMVDRLNEAFAQVAQFAADVRVSAAEYEPMYG